MWGWAKYEDNFGLGMPLVATPFGIYHNGAWYIVATFMFNALVTTGARNAFGIFIIRFLLFPAALSAFTIKERRYSMRYQTPPAVAAASGD